MNLVINRADKPAEISRCLFRFEEERKIMAQYLVLKAEDICDDNDCVKSRLIYYYEHYALLNESFFRETEYRTAVAALDVCGDLDVLPGIYELFFTEEKEEQPGLMSVKFIKPVDMWELQDKE